MEINAYLYECSCCLHARDGRAGVNATPAGGFAYLSVRLGRRVLAAEALRGGWFHVVLHGHHSIP
jgi:hypothetical protein